MKEREGGFIKIHRKILSSPVFLSLSAEQRSVFFTLLYLANWKDNPVLIDGQWAVIKRGELFHSLKTIAKESNCGVQVVRTAIEKLSADDRAIGGNGPVITFRPLLAETSKTNTATNTGPRVITVCNYGKYQDVPDSVNTPANTPPTRVQHAANTPPTPIEEGKEGEAAEEPTVPTAGAAATPRLSLEAQDAPKKARKLSAAQEFANKLLAKRASTFPIECPPVDVVVLNRLLGDLLKRFGEVGVETAWSRYLADAHWKAEGCPLNAFLSPKVHLRFFQSGPLPQQPKQIDLSAIPAATNLYPDAQRSPNGNDQR